MNKRTALARLLFILEMLIIAVIMAGELPSRLGPCRPQQLAADRAAYDQVIADWRVANHAASLIRNPAELEGPILVLAQVRDRAYQADLGPCLADARIAALKGMDATITGYEAAQADHGEEMARAFGQAGNWFRKATEALP
jgi:hypothetical protein